jgi:hypothetical protein
MNDENFVHRLRGAMIGGFAEAEKLPGYAEAESLEKWRMAAECTMRSLPTADRAKLEDAFDHGRIPGFREANDAIWKATGGMVLTLDVDSSTGIVKGVFLAPQPDREVDHG